MLHSLSSLLSQAQPTSGGGTTTLIMFGVFAALFLVTLAGAWRVFSKAGQPGWGAIVPFYNVLLMCRIAGRPGWWLVLFLLPIVNLVIAVMVAIGMARNFGRGALFGIGLLLLPFPFYPLLGFSRAKYMVGGAEGPEPVEVTEPTGTGRPI